VTSLASSQVVSNANRQSTATQISNQRRLAVWFFVLTLFIAFLVLVGGTVRITDSGLSIPEWPIINGSLLPPFAESDWIKVYNTYYEKIHAIITTGPSDSRYTDLLTLNEFRMLFAVEYFHRFMAAVVSILFLALFLQVMRSRPSRGLRRLYSKRLIGMAVLLVCQAVLGGIVVRLDLKAEFVAVHLGLAFAFFALVFWTGLQLCFGAERRTKKSFLLKLSNAALLLVYLQVIGGGMVAATKAGYIFNTWPHMGTSLIPEMNQLWQADIGSIWQNMLKNPILIQFFHRWFAFVTAAAVFTLVFVGMKTAINNRARLALRAIASVVVLQIMLGITTLVMKVQAVVAIAHLMVGLLLFALLVWCSFELGLKEGLNEQQDVG
jgi:cytochrome c oxidase assembly protein subunit 15